MISREEAIAMAKKAWDDSGEGWVHPGWFDDRGGALEALVNLAYARGLQDAANALRPSFIGEYPAGSGKEDRYDLARADYCEVVMKMKDEK